MISTLWREGGPTHKAVEWYTEGDCWVLAYYVSKISGFPIFLPGGLRHWDHALVHIGYNQYLDITGILTKNQMRRFWYFRADAEYTLQNTFSTFEEYHRFLSTKFMWPFRPCYDTQLEYTEEIANLLLRKYNVG